MLDKYYKPADSSSERAADNRAAELYSESQAIGAQNGNLTVPSKDLQAMSQDLGAKSQDLKTDIQDLDAHNQDLEAKFAGFPEPYLWVRNLTHRFAGRPGEPDQLVLDQINFRIFPGQFTGLLGESGSGKSTLARLISGQLNVQEGEILLNGQVISTLSRRQRRRAKLGIQMVFQDPFSSLHPRQIIGRQLEEPLILQTKLPADARQAKIHQMLEEVGLDPEIANRYPQDLSGGQQQRVAIACALITEPELLIADEPVSALDPSVQAQILNLLMKVRQQQSFACLFISHDLDVVSYLCDRVAVLREGKICEENKVERIFTNPQHPYTKQLISYLGK